MHTHTHTYTQLTGIPLKSTMVKIKPARVGPPMQSQVYFIAKFDYAWFPMYKREGMRIILQF